MPFSRWIYVGLVFLFASVTKTSSQELGWYVIAGSYNYEIFTEDKVRRESNRLMKCGFNSEISSVMFSKHFTTGVFIVHNGPFKTASEAKLTLKQVLPCKPDAYLKFGQFVVYH